jgi:hypothetical protein
MKTLRNGDCSVTHREYIGEITANAGGPPTTFNVQSYAVHPGLQTLFPWLSKIAAHFARSNYSKLNVCYETEAPSSLGGTLVLALDYDALDAAPASKQQALAYRGSVRSAPWNDCRHTSGAEDLHKFKSRFIRTAAAPATADLKTYDVGNLFAITQGVTTASATCGELYVEYSVHLMTPVFDYPVPQAGGLIVSGGTESAANPLGDAPVVDAQALGFTVDAASVITFTNPGTYFLASYVQVANTLTDIILTGTAGAVVTANQVAQIPAAATTGSRTWNVVVSAASATVALTAAAGVSLSNSFLSIAIAPTGSLA